MSMSASTPLVFFPSRVERSAANDRPAALAREGRWTRLLRGLADRRHLREMDARLLRDVGLTREDVRRGLPFHTDASRPAGLIRLGTLDARDCRLKLYAPAAEAAGLRPEDLAAARRAFRAVLAEPCRGPVAGFALLAGLYDADLPAGSLVLTAHRWEGTVLRRCALLLPVEYGPVRRLPEHGLGLAELLLAGREGRAWQRHASRPSPATLAAYLAEDCA